MPYFKSKDCNILLIHIPKTGGTSLETYFSLKYNISLNNYSLFDFILPETKINQNMCIYSSLQHLTYTQIMKYQKVFHIDFNNIKILTIVRNPYERIISDLFFFKKINIHSSKKEVYAVILTYLISHDLDNHNIPQYVFITDNNKQLISNIHILHTETLTSEMKALGYTDFNIFMQKNKEENINYYNYLNEESISVINNWYHYDFILFNYSKK